MDDMVVMGRIVAPYGVLGWVKVVPNTEAIDGLKDYKNWWLGKGSQWQEYTPEKTKVHNDILLVKFAGVNDRDLAITCKGKQVAVPRTALPKTEEGAFYWSDLIGLAVTNKEGIAFGQLVDVFETGANDVIVVRPESVKVEASAEQPQNTKKDTTNNERLIPFIASVIVDVDLQAKTMLVDWDEDY